VTTPERIQRVAAYNVCVDADDRLLLCRGTEPDCLGLVAHLLGFGVGAIVLLFLALRRAR